MKIEHINGADRAYLARAYSSFMKRYDTYGVFIEKSLSLLGREGRFGMIIPSTLLNNLSFRRLRKLLLKSAAIESIVNLGGKIFKGVNNDTLILILKKDVLGKTLTQVKEVLQYGSGMDGAKEVGAKDLRSAAKPPDYLFELRTSIVGDAILNKMEKENPRVKEICSIFQGLVTGSNPAFIVTPMTIKKEKLEKELCKHTVFGDETPRYGKPEPKTLVIYLTKESDLDKCPKIAAHLYPYRNFLEKKREVVLGRQPWYSLHWPRDQANFERSPKILVQTIRNLSLKRRIVATIDLDGLYADHTLNVIYTTQDKYDLRYILGILNSKLTNFMFLKKYIDINIKGVYLADIPIRAIEFSSVASVDQHNLMIRLVDKIMELNCKFSGAKTPIERELYQRQITATEKEIDQLVYQLYGLTVEEVKAVEEAN